ncbi:hypothetical protein SEA_REYNAULD_26 [Rhodococcus phage Reynauld]|uniref:Uncharacterized protein n=1 Tax=Rhodococcus phage Reynauld TaxID=3062845 RepID=A0ACD4UHH3_9CAUD|nr:hypothetical protein SEA_REYNAULD_26 [Rhodococcus phage Reynauld]
MADNDDGVQEQEQEPRDEAQAVLDEKRRRNEELAAELRAIEEGREEAVRVVKQKEEEDALDLEAERLRAQIAFAREMSQGTTAAAEAAESTDAAEAAKVAADAAKDDAAEAAKVADTKAAETAAKPSSTPLATAQAARAANNTPAPAAGADTKEGK